MPRSPLDKVVSQWSKLFEGLQASSDDFYTAVEDAVLKRDVPSVSITRVQWSEGGVLSPEREYLRITGDRHCIDVCAAPFGTGYFYSIWVSIRPARYVLLVGLLFFLADLALCGLVSAIIVPAALVASFGFLMFAPWIMLLIGPVFATLFLLCLVSLMARSGKVGLELAILALPVLGWLYQTLFAPVSFYRLDSLTMFSTAVHAAVHEAIDQTTAQKGLRALTDEERKPILHKLM